MANKKSKKWRLKPDYIALARPVLIALIIIGFAASGYVLMRQSQAAGMAAMVEAESGTLAGAAAISDQSAASGGKAVTFGSGAGNPGTIFLGAAIEPNQLDNPAFVNALKQYKFDSLTAENAMKQQNIHPSANQWNWGPSDKIVNFAQANGMRVRGHTLLWYRDPPSWLTSVSAGAAAQAAAKEHIQTIVSRYKGKVVQWDVVNEALEDDGRPRSNDEWRRKVGENYIELAFRWAREADPTAQLYYNEYSAESRDLDGNGGTSRAAKSDAVFNMVKDFKARGVPIDGIGFQTHSAGLYPGTETALRENMVRLKGLGVNVEITELDTINIGDETAKANRYAAIGRACKAAGNCTGVTTWGLYDGHTWRGTAAAPLMLDVNFKAKPSYFSLTQAIGR